MALSGLLAGRDYLPETLAHGLLIIPWAVQAQSQEVTPTAGATGANPPAKPTNLQTSGAHDEAALTWTASSDQTVTRYAILRRNPDADALGVFHLIESNASPETSYTDGSVSPSSTYIYRVKAVSPTGVSQWSGFVKADTPAPPDPTPTTTPEPEPEPQTDPASISPTNLIAALPEGSGLVMSWDTSAEEADCVAGYEILRTVGQRDLTALAGRASTSREKSRYSLGTRQTGPYTSDGGRNGGTCRRSLRRAGVRHALRPRTGPTLELLSETDIREPEPASHGFRAVGAGEYVVWNWSYRQPDRVRGGIS